MIEASSTHTERHAMKTEQGKWLIGANGNAFADMGGFRYCVDYPHRAGGAFRVLRNGTEIAVGIKTADEAKAFAEQDAAKYN